MSLAHLNPPTILFPSGRYRDRDEIEHDEREAADEIRRTGRWKAGNPGSSRFRVTVDGEPKPLAIEADVCDGWAKVYQVKVGCEYVGEARIVTGKVELIGIRE